MRNFISLGNKSPIRIFYLRQKTNQQFVLTNMYNNELVGCDLP